MRVLHLSAGNLYGGVESLLVTLARERHLCAAMEPSFALCFEGRLSEELSAAGVPVHRMGTVRFSRPWTMWQARRRLRTHLAREHFDVAVCHECWVHVLFAPVLRRCRVPVAFCGHDAHRGTHWVERWAARTAPDVVLANSRWTCEGLARLFPGIPIECLHLPVTDRTPRDRLAARLKARAALGTPEEAVVIVMAARLERFKGQTVLLQALRGLKGLPAWECWLAGGAQRPHELQYLEELRRLAGTIGLGDRVRFLGHRTDVPDLLAAADIYCQSNTEPETFGISFIEALYSGLPVVTSALGGALEIVNEGCGVLVAPADPGQLTEALACLIADPDRRARLAQGGPRRAAKLCAPAEQMKRWSGALARVAGRPPALLAVGQPAPATEAVR